MWLRRLPGSRKFYKRIGAGGSQHEPRMVPDNHSGRSGKRDGGFAFSDKRVRRADKTQAGGFHIVAADTTR